MAASRYTQRLRALEYAIASSSPDDTPQDIVTRAQIYADWLAGTFALTLRYETTDGAACAGNGNVVPIKPGKTDS
jgi:hypothetical protein